ncbi:hypothetical protein QFC20_006120 [Naganishia adeliensis]|uniref:Uncharacterized protein n=1 Tax=Naganishia adeliensis TaxID=92952 RepID=A0ACC2VF28_9TREE|nr:hypothetical protein QFC20_006120 [Naganishia adeliensis]
MNEEAYATQHHQQRYRPTKSQDDDDEGETERQTSEAEKTGLRHDDGCLETERRRWEEKEKMYQDRIEELERHQRLTQQDFQALAAYKMAPEKQQDGTVAEASRPTQDIERIATPLILPVKSLANIAGFLAGDNDYVTLANFSSTSRLVSSALSSTLYETVLWNEALNTRMKSAQADGIYPPKWKYIRFIVVDQHFWQHEPNSVDAAFPNLRACIVKRKHFPYQRSNGEGSPPQYTVNLEVMKDTTLASLSSILRHPLRWFLAGEPYRYNVALGVASVKVASTATFSIRSCNPYPSGILFESTQNEISRLSVRFQSDIGVPARSGEQVEACLQAILVLRAPDRFRNCRRAIVRATHRL